MSIYEDCQSNVHLDYAFKVDNCPLSSALAKIWNDPIWKKGVGMPQITKGVGMPQSTKGVGMPQSTKGIGMPQITRSIGMPQITTGESGMSSSRWLLH